MSKIEEMAKEYAEKLLAGNMLNTYKEYSLQTQKTMPIFEAYDIEQAYEDGAKAVLKEIEKAMKECDVDGSPFVAILDKIKKLKQQ